MEATQNRQNIWTMQRCILKIYFLYVKENEMGRACRTNVEKVMHVA
jgi:hypothetical protein